MTECNALGELATEMIEFPGVGFVLGPFGDDVHAKIVRKPYDRP